MLLLEIKAPTPPSPSLQTCAVGGEWGHIAGDTGGDTGRAGRVQGLNPSPVTPSVWKRAREAPGSLLRGSRIIEWFGKDLKAHPTPPLCMGRGRHWMSFKVPSSTNHSTIVWTALVQSIKYHGYRNPQKQYKRLSDTELLGIRAVQASVLGVSEGWEGENFP